MGSLVILPHRIILKGGRVAAAFSGQEEVVHVRDRVQLIKARLAPPWMNRIVIVDGESAVAAANVSFCWSDVQASLRRAGFTLDEKKTWFSLGGKLVR
jgi:hypothetical protein